MCSLFTYNTFKKLTELEWQKCSHQACNSFFFFCSSEAHVKTNFCERGEMKWKVTIAKKEKKRIENKAENGRFRGWDPPSLGVYLPSHVLLPFFSRLIVTKIQDNSPVVWQGPIICMNWLPIIRTKIHFISLNAYCVFVSLLPEWNYSRHTTMFR